MVAWSKQKGIRSGLRIEKGMSLHPESLALHATERTGKLGPEIVAPETWIAQNWYDRQIEVTEQSWTLDGYNSVLTLLVVVDNDQPQELDMVDRFEWRLRRR
jgi:hypothetical protein